MFVNAVRWRSTFILPRWRVVTPGHVTHESHLHPRSPSVPHERCFSALCSVSLFWGLLFCVVLSHCSGDCCSVFCLVVLRAVAVAPKYCFISKLDMGRAHLFMSFSCLSLGNFGLLLMYFRINLCSFIKRPVRIWIAIVLNSYINLGVELNLYAVESSQVYTWYSFPFVEVSFMMLSKFWNFSL